MGVCWARSRGAEDPRTSRVGRSNRRVVRLWTVHPKYLDAQGLVALWREGLLALQVLRGRTQGYRHHPQLVRFRSHRRPLVCIARYLTAVHAESLLRGYQFDARKVSSPGRMSRLTETEGQLQYEWKHLKRKLRIRSPERYRRFRQVLVPDPHPLFRIVPGGVRHWERVPRPAPVRRADWAAGFLGSTIRAPISESTVAGPRSRHGRRRRHGQGEGP